jgi:DNA ligase-4
LRSCLFFLDERLTWQETSIELFRSFLPQLCYRSPSSSHDGIAKLVNHPRDGFLMEEKLDGERMQLHMRGNGAQWYYCSRKAKDYSESGMGWDGRVIGFWLTLG